MNKVILIWCMGYNPKMFDEISSHIFFIFFVVFFVLCQFFFTHGVLIFYLLF